jgi:hypothetical protein
MKLREKTLIFLEGLFAGQEIEVEMCKGIKHKITLIENSLVIVALKTNSENKEIIEKVYLTSDISLNQFIDICNTMSDNNISIIAGNTTLIKTNKQNRKHVKEI